MRRTRDVLACRKRSPRSRRSFGSQSSAGTGIGDRSRAIACTSSANAGGAPANCSVRTVASACGPPRITRIGRPLSIRSRTSAASRGSGHSSKRVRALVADATRTLEDDQGVVALDRGGQAHARRSYAKRGRLPSQELHICRRRATYIGQASSGVVDQPGPARDRGRLTARLDLELAEDPRHVQGRGPLGDVQLPADLPVRPAFRDQHEHLVLAARQPFLGAGGLEPADDGALAGACARRGCSPTPRAGSRPASRRP